MPQTTTPTWIDHSLLDEVSTAAAESPRRRRNRNFHGEDTSACHRLLNGIEPDSYIRPHRHSHPDKDESILCIRGRLGALFFNADGTLTATKVLDAGGPTIGVDIPHRTFHSLVALEPGTVFFEAKAGPYEPLGEDDIASWAPAEGDNEATSYHAQLAAHFE
ncbi:MAG: WbuC family cupin fold metalloprotein [Candidatus Binatia bacterium]|nr:WbuC family cupin fold metalloprotein [Candidatus Binatia bacterium]